MTFQAAGLRPGRRAGRAALIPSGDAADGVAPNDCTKGRCPKCALCSS
jgi:hypothetical protein